MFTMNQVNAALRHVYTAVAASTAVLVYVGFSQGDATAIGAAVKQIGDGLASVVAGVTTLIPIGSAAYAAWKASRKQQVATVASVPGTIVAIPEQKIANELPSNVKGPADRPML